MVFDLKKRSGLIEKVTSIVEKKFISGNGNDLTNRGFDAIFTKVFQHQFNNRRRNRSEK